MLRDYYFESNKHQHLRCSFELPTSEGLQYEVGDIIRFNKSPNNTDPYGKNITTTYAIIDQDVTPYFFITSVSKSLFSVKIKCIQTHRMSYELPPVTLLGDINLDGQVDLSDLLDMLYYIAYEDINLFPEVYPECFLFQGDISIDNEINFLDIQLF